LNGRCEGRPHETRESVASPHGHALSAMLGTHAECPHPTFMQRGLFASRLGQLRYTDAASVQCDGQASRAHIRVRVFKLATIMRTPCPSNPCTATHRGWRQGHLLPSHSTNSHVACKEPSRSVYTGANNKQVTHHSACNEALHYSFFAHSALGAALASSPSCGHSAWQCVATLLASATRVAEAALRFRLASLNHERERRDGAVSILVSRSVRRCDRLGHHWLRLCR